MKNNYSTKKYPNSVKANVLSNDSSLSSEMNLAFNNNNCANNLSPIKNSITMENFYNSTGVSSPTRTEQCLSLAKGSSSSFFKTFALALAMLVVGIGGVWGQTITVTDPASPWSVPTGVTSINVVVQGGGGSGGSCGNGSSTTSNGGGGAGGNSAVGIFNVTPSQTYTITRGAGGKSEDF